MTDEQEAIAKHLAENRVVLYMKGTPQFPQCGFSALVVSALKACGLGANDFYHCNVLLDQETRQGIKKYANWPTIPQLYIGGEFIGGADIVRGMCESGELQRKLDSSRDGSA